MLIAGSVSAYAAAKAPLASVSSPDRVAVSGSRVSFANVTDSEGWDMFAFDGADGETVRFGGAGDQLSGDIDGDIVVYEDHVTGDPDIRGYDLVEGRVFDIAVAPGAQTRPRVSGDWVVWSELGLGSAGPVLALDVRTGEQVLVAGASAANPEISGSLVVYEDHSGSAVRVMAFDLAEKTSRIVLASDSDQLMPVTDGEWIAWAQPGTDGYDVAFAKRDGSGATIVDRIGEQTLPVLDNGRLSFADRVAGSPVSVSSLDLPNGAVVTDQVDDDVIVFDSDGASSVSMTRGDADAWEIDAALEPVSLVDRVGRWVASAWRGVAPRRYASWAESGATFSAGEVVQAAALRQPKLTGAVVGPSGVTLSWESPRSLAGVKDYDVYRYTRPITGKNLRSATKVATVAKLTYLDAIEPSEDATAKAASFYYAVVARDHEDTLSRVSNSVSPNPHGADVYRSGTGGSCDACHDMHLGSNESTSGALGALSAQRCYGCHGSTPKTGQVGIGAYSDIEGFFGDDGTDTVGPRLAEGGSVHRNTTMVQSQRECVACHDPHARSYVVDSKGRYDEAKSAGKMLRTQTGAGEGKSKTWTDATPSGNSICLSCHGSTMTPITIAGGPAAYARSGGDHTANGDSTYDDSAHSPSSVKTDDAGEVQCLVCHNQHSSATARLIDYRQSNTSDPNENRQARLCLKCHTGSDPSTWNGRDLGLEFARASTHPSYTTTAAASGSATCVSCHNTHFVQKGEGAWDASRVSNPANTTSPVVDTTTFCLGCHSKSSQDGSFKMAAVAGTDRLVPYAVSMRATTLWPFFGGWNKSAEGTEFLKSGHATASARAGRAGCETCHDPHASDFSSLTAWSRPERADIQGGLTGERANTAAFADRSKEENLCLQCHGDGTDGTGKAAGAQDVYTAMQEEYAHPITRSDVHSDKESVASLADSRHAECVDCHDPHAAREGASSAGSSVAGNVLRGAIGVVPTWVARNWGEAEALSPQKIVPGAGRDYEAYLCFKCHSVTGEAGSTASAGLRTDVAREFNPANFSYHRVLGTEQSGVRENFEVTPDGSGSSVDVAWRFPSDNVFRTGMDKNEMMTCSSCHASHGSSSKYLLDSEYPVDWDSTAARLTESAPGMPEGLVCSKCHSLTDGSGNWGNNVHAQHASMSSSYASCRNCHGGVPHGSSRPRLLGSTDDPLPYSTWRSNGGGSASGDWGLTRVKVKASTSPQGWVASDCYAGCHEVHGANIRSYWP